MRRPSIGVFFGALLVGGTISLAGFGAGCGPIEYVANVPADAAGAIAEAKHVNAEKYAVYEITAAEQYIDKARELAGYARFQSAVTFGRKAADNARKAKQIALDKAAQPDANDAPVVNGGTDTQPAAGTESHTTTPQKIIIVPAAPSENPSK